MIDDERTKVTRKPPLPIQRPPSSARGAFRPTSQLANSGIVPSAPATLVGSIGSAGMVAGQQSISSNVTMGVNVTGNNSMMNTPNASTTINGNGNGAAALLRTAFNVSKPSSIAPHELMRELMRVADINNIMYTSPSIPLPLSSPVLLTGGSNGSGGNNNSSSMSATGVPLMRAAFADASNNNSNNNDLVTSPTTTTPGDASRTSTSATAASLLRGNPLMVPTSTSTASGGRTGNAPKLAALRLPRGGGAATPSSGNGSTGSGGGWTLECEKGSTRFEMTIAPLPHMSGMHIIRVKRISGDAWLYKELCNRVLPQLVL
jgi:hypothetical protein